MHTLNLTDTQLNVISSALMHRKIELQKQRTKAIHSRIAQDFKQSIATMDEITQLIYNARKQTAINTI